MVGICQEIIINFTSIVLFCPVLSVLVLMIVVVGGIRSSRSGDLHLYNYTYSILQSNLSIFCTLHSVVY